MTLEHSAVVEGVTTDALQHRIEALEREVQALRAAAENRNGRALVLPRAVTAPTASEVTRGLVYVTFGAAGVADTVSVILKSAGDTYSAVTIATG